MSNEEGRVIWVDSVDELAHRVRSAPPPDIDPADAFARAPSVPWVEVESDVVIYQVSTKTAFVLNSLAALLWQCLDGCDSLEAVLTDVADAYEVPSDRILRDFLPLVADLVADELLEVVPHD